MPEPMTDGDLVNISHRLACRYVFRDEDTGEMWIDGGALQRVDVEALLAEVHRLRDGIVEVARDLDLSDPRATTVHEVKLRDLIGDDDA